jgi:polysaccharide export outer membrane protein
MRSSWSTAAAALLVLTASLGCGSSAPPVSQVATLPEPEAPRSIPLDPARQAFTERSGFPEYIIGAGDVLRLALRDVQVTRETVTVRPDGFISFAMLENVAATGRTPTELDDDLTQQLARFLRSPKVDVEVVEYHSKVVSLLGAIEILERAGVKSGQGRYPLKGKTTVLDLVLEAGGSTPDSQIDRVQLIRGDATYRLDLQKVLASGDVSQNAVLQGGDIVIVPGASLRSKKVIVLGEVARPNVYMFPDDARLMEALSQAGGFNDAALRDDIRLIRVVEGTPQMYSVNFERLATRGDFRQNVPLETDDIIYVPRSFIGDVNDVITKIEPLLNILLLPATYRDLYTTGGGLRLDTGEAEGSGGFVRNLPGTSKPAGDGDGKDDGADE